MDESVKESAIAVQEVAKASGKAVDGIREFGGFIARFTAGTIEQGVGIFEDKLKYYRWENQVRLMVRANRFLKDNGLTAPTRPIPLKFAIPLLEAASLEDDNYLQDLWTKLLVNAANIDSGVDLRNSYIDILKNLTPLEAHILEKIYSQPYEIMQHNGIVTEDLPDHIKVGEETKIMQAKEPKKEIQLALANLSRLGCINPGRTLGGGEIFSIINPTLLGKYFIEACTLQRKTSNV